MSTISFYPGPSRVYSNINEYLYDAQMKGYYSINHRSEQFMSLFQKTKDMLRDRLLIPDNYEIAVVSSATECWEIIAQSFTKKKSHHLVNGAFAKKWLGFAGDLVETSFEQFGIEELPSGEVPSDADVLCYTQNETSNGTAVPLESMAEFRKKFQGIIAVDATSSMGGIRMNWAAGDIWFASVQKCFGLPAGMALLILSPDAVSRAGEIGDTHYNSAVRILENTRNNQTHYTPNVLDIYLLYRTQKYSKGIDAVYEKLERKYRTWVDFINKLPGFEFLISNEEVRSKTVLTLEHQNPEKVLRAAGQKGMILGKGYGDWKENTFRIANFPAIKSREIDKLERFFLDY